MEKLIILLLVLMFQISLISQDDGMRIGGYLENTTNLTFADTAFFSDNALLRIEGSYEIAEKAEIEAHIIFSTGLQPINPFAGIDDNALMDRLVDEMISDIDTTDVGIDPDIMEFITTFDLNNLNYLAYSSIYPKDKFTFDRALIKLYFKYADIFIGRQQIGWGTGYAFNPTDIWNMKNPTDPTAAKMGVDAFNVSFPVGDLGSLSFIFTPGNDIAHCGYGSRYKNNLFGYDYSFSLVKYHNADRELYGLPEKILVGSDFSGQIIGGIGIFGEGVFVNPKYEELEFTDTDSSYFQTTIGFDYTLDNGIYLMAEYYYNGLGNDDRDNYNSVDFINLYSGEMAGFGMNYLFSMAKYDFWDDYTLSLNNLFNIDDKSGVIMPNLEYLFSEDISITLKSSIYIGSSSKSEYGGMFNTFGIKVTGFF